ncbi:GspE/PulE family protein [Escherichia coli]|uniref:GspE/PulE family protein n=1 Tax=Escherichia coli TaxID=562 RepID=UPI000ACDC923|nr:ATPase, T2SS/T4P/T4SS family [Escherichia coli]MDZ8442992.1 ATPase, T2SS/T4P/T4SS family [Escherichia coli]MDZ8496289.1 ATPase, T2SS/T4P/T4SS family [Escherichia coli]MDZ8747023.1 ATPase, T2SS/T4P/T4SS family [Escherichia coli]MDZ8829607.1 ATPase, T2SS/T4P/T4SS family [Escherichia coli]MEA0446766.1 ATPase, T2SS/T4P/T4SS family [Escherichia coli]
MKNSSMIVEQLKTADDQDFLRFRKNISDIVTVKGGLIETTDEQKKICIIYKNGDFLISTEHLENPSIRFLKEVAIRKGIQNITCYKVSLRDIRLLYQEQEKKVIQSSSLPMEKIASDLIHECCDLRVSDLHIKVYADEAEIFIRKDGDMFLLRQIEAEKGHSLLAALYNTAEDADSTYKLNSYQAARIIASKSRISIPERLQSIRLQFNPLGQGGRYMIARFLYVEKTSITSIEALNPVKYGFHPVQAEAFKRLRQLPIGVNIISGPTGSGKSTTLKNILELLYIEKKAKVNIISIEDPPEYEITGTAQLPITNVDTEDERATEYRKAITAALRSDPDIIMPGEARDAEVINLVFTAAMTGHQVWTSLHANSAVSIFDRLKDQGVDSFKLIDPELVTGLVAQRLVKKLCPQCSLTYQEFTQSNVLSEIEENIIQGYHDSIRFPNNDGCSHCQSGYSGRTIIAEIIEPDQVFLSLIDQGKRNEAVNYWQSSLSGITMRDHAWMKIISGEIYVLDAVHKIAKLESLSNERREYLRKLCFLEDDYNA